MFTGFGGVPTGREIDSNRHIPASYRSTECPCGCDKSPTRQSHPDTQKNETPKK